MAIFDFLKKPKEPRTTEYLQYINSGDSFFTTTTDIYKNDVIKGITNRVASAVMKTEAKHYNNKGRRFDNIHKMLNIRPNELMTPANFYEMITVQLMINSNALVYIDFHENGKPKALYPVDYVYSQFLQDPNGKVYVSVVNQGGNDVILSYDSIIHLRRNFKTHLKMIYMSKVERDLKKSEENLELQGKGSGK